MLEGEWRAKEERRKGGGEGVPLTKD
jgi:hypothetical protein